MNSCYYSLDIPSKNKYGEVQVTKDLAATKIVDTQRMSSRTALDHIVNLVSN